MQFAFQFIPTTWSKELILHLKQGGAAVASITSVLYLKDDISIATVGAADSILRFWDTRNLKSHVTQACPQIEAVSKKVQGISSLSPDSSGVFLTASCMDKQLDKGSMQTFSGCQIESFYVKLAISPDADYILGGFRLPVMEMLTFGRCLSEARIWSIEASHWSRSPSSIGTRVQGIGSTESRRLLMNYKGETGSSSCSSNEPSHHIQINSPSTAESHKRKLFWISDSNETAFEKTPEASMKNSSPSSVLSPPSSLKRKTIKDYFLATP